MDSYIMHVVPEYYDLIKSGDKKVEFRLFDKKRSLIKVGDKINFLCENVTTECVTATVSQILRAPNFLTLLNSVPSSFLGGMSKEKQLRDLISFYGNNQEKDGVIAIFLK